MTGQIFDVKKKWFSASAPVNPKAATGTLTYTGVVADAQTVTIGSEIYEFKTSGNAGAGKIKVDVSGGVTAANAVTALVASITANSAKVNAVDGAGDTVVVTYKTTGTGGNVASTTTCTNGSWGTTTLEGGQYGTPCPETGLIVKDGTYHYVCTSSGNKDDVAWKRFTLASY